MATIRAYTTIEQSRKLAEILPVESADMWYEDCVVIIPRLGKIPKEHSEKELPCWSLAALLDIIPKRIKECNILRIDIGEKDFSIWYDEMGYGVNNEFPDITKESAVDACVEIIFKLHELKML